MAYIRVTHTRHDPARDEEVAQAVAASVAVIAQLPGFQHSTAAVDRASGKGIGITTFDTLAHAQFSRDALRSGVMAQLQAAGVTAAAPEFYEVV